MRILLVHNSLYYPSNGGGDRSNRLLMEALAARGETVQVFSRLEEFSAESQTRWIAELQSRGVTPQSADDGLVQFERAGVQVFTAASNPHIRASLRARIQAFDPDVILCSTDDPGAILLDVALRADRARVVYLVRATVALPFGPDASALNPAKTQLLAGADSVIGVSRYVADYVKRWGGIDSIHVPISLLEPGDYSTIGSFASEFVLMVNPCAVKGISIFAALAEAMPELQFATIPTWGTTAEDLALLRSGPNIAIFQPMDDLTPLLRRTRVVLVPSVWAEARSRMVVEAMIRAIPVVASDVGGLREAKLGVEYILPVRQIVRYQPRVDANMVPIPDVPPQDIAPWKAALERLSKDEDHWNDVARRSREAALEYAGTLHCGWLIEHLRELLEKPKRAAPQELSPVKRKLLELRLAKSRSLEWFPGLADADTRVLFCFPWAGAGSIAYKSLADALAPERKVVGVRLPGRETRVSEPPFTDMTALIAALLDAIRPHLNRDFAFYGHSMGAGIAFELTRALRAGGLPLPRALFVASACAPQRRTVAAPVAAKVALTAIEADLTLYTRYRFQPAPPLHIPLEAFHGTEDTSLHADQIGGWRAQTTDSFAFHEVPGPHLFLSEPAALRIVAARLLF